jgi:predicted dehydrogenase
MINIALVGSGELGSRHLQSLMGIENSIITVVEPSQVAVKISHQRILESNEIKNADIFFVDEINELPKEIEFVVIATGASPRLSIIRDIFSHARVKYLLLEKILFQSVKDYAEAVQIIESQNVKVWVNCPRRMFQFYSLIKLNLDTSKSITMEVNGGNWGLACNSIHFIDIFSFLTESKVIKVCTDQLENKIYPSKREGYIEFYGVLIVTYSNGHILKLNCFNLDLPMEIKIHSIDGTCAIDEASGSVFYNSKESNIKASVKHQSELTRSVVEDALCFNQSKLVNFNEACEQHIPLIKALLLFYNETEGLKVSILPVT